MTRAESRKLTEAIVANYQLGMSVEQLAEKHRLSSFAVIVRLTKAKVYKRPPYATKYGVPAMTKEGYINIIEVETDLSLPTLIRAGKEDIRQLALFFTKGEDLEL